MLIDDMRVWCYDCEVFAHDWLFVFKDTESGDRHSFWNDPEGLELFVEEHGDSLFCSFNGSRYDQYILKAVIGGCSPEQVKEVNDSIIGTDDPPWEHPNLRGVWVDFNDVDLMKDTQMGTSLKSIEAHSGMSIEESSVPFDWPDPLTDEQMDEVERYCVHDVDATEMLLGLRDGYLLTKLSLGKRAGIPTPRSLAMTNAKLTAAVLGAEAPDEARCDERAYVYPDNLKREFVPREAFEFFDRMLDGEVSDEELWSSKLDLEVGGCPVTLGFGGIHGALPKYSASSGDGRVLVNADVASYYPSLMVRNGYTSRNMPNPGLFEDIYHERLSAKKAGDKETANSLKLVVNTTYGATLNRYNDLYDPLMARSVCVSGQLYLLQLSVQLSRFPSVRIVQLNTDGILVELPDDWRNTAIEECFERWQAETGFTLEFDDVAMIAQKDVNNYCMRLDNGKVKVKGAWFVRGHSTAGAFKINNNATIVADALKAYLLDGKPLRETIEGCTDSSKFQLVAKASGKYERVYQLSEAADGTQTETPMQKCNRVFAARDAALGTLYKVKKADGSVAKVEGLPEHCLVCNGGFPDISEIDTEWYIALAEQRALAFLKEEEMAQTKPKEPDYTALNVYQKLALARRMFLETNPTKSGKNSKMEYTYFELEDIVPAQTRIFAEVGLLEQFYYQEPAPIEREDGSTDWTEAIGFSRVVNTDRPDEEVYFKLKWGEVAQIISNKTGKPTNQPIQDLGMAQTYMRRYLKMQVLDIVEHDAVDGGDSVEEERPAKVKAPSAAKPARKKPAAASERKAVKKAVTAADGKCTALQLKQLKSSIKKMVDGFGEEHPEVKAYVAELSADTGKLTHAAGDESKPFSKAECEAAIQHLGEMREQFEEA